MSNRDFLGLLNQSSPYSIISYKEQDNPTSSRPPHRHIQIPAQTYRTNSTHHPTSQKVREVLLEWRLWKISKTSKLPSHSSNPPQTRCTPPSTGVYYNNRPYSQHPVYFVSRSLQDPKTRYMMVEKLALSYGKCRKTAPPILPKPPYHCQNRLPHPENPPETRPCQTNVIMGRRAFRKIQKV